MPNVLYAYVDGQCDKLATDDRHQYINIYTDHPSKSTASETIDATTLPAAVSEAAEGNEKWGVEVGIADKNWGSNAACRPRTRKSAGSTDLLDPGAPRPLRRSRDTVGAHETLSGSCDLSTTLSVMVKVIDATSIEGFMVLRTMHMRRRNYSDDTL